ncbi:E3 ubiquitin-protein ligase TRIM21-like isoform X2 [Hoplias malabaricus]
MKCVGNYCHMAAAPRPVSYQSSQNISSSLLYSFNRPQQVSTTDYDPLFRPATRSDLIRQSQQVSTTDYNTTFRPATRSVAPQPELPVSISRHLTCSICTDVPSNPVTTKCSHTFCKICLDLHLTVNNRACPVCKEHQPMKPRVNLMLKGVLEDYGTLQKRRTKEFSVEPDDVIFCTVRVESDTDTVSMVTERGKREKLAKVIKDLEERIQQRKEKVKEFERSKAECLAVIDREQEEIKEVFLAVKEVVQRAEQEALRPLKEKKQRVEREEKQLKEELQREIINFSERISKLKKSYPSVPASDNAKDWTNVTMDTDLSLSTFRKTMKTLMSDIETELEKLSNIEIQRIKKFAVDVILDPDTANSQLLVSSNGKAVRDSGRKKDVQDTPERFDLFGSVLGQNRLTGSRAFWVVDVGDKQGWDIGVAREDANRKGKLCLKPSQGYWAIVLYDGDHYVALEDPLTPLTLQEKPRKVGVFVDQRERVVSFYDIEAKTHIYSFTDCGFSAVIRPYFSPHLNQADRNSSPLVICPVDHSD